MKIKYWIIRWNRIVNKVLYTFFENDKVRFSKFNFLFILSIEKWGIKIFYILITS